MNEGTGLGTQVGTLAYVAPEMRGNLDQDHKVFRRYDTKIDVWSLGVMLHEILTKKHPFREPGRSRFSELQYRMFPQNNGRPVSLDALDRRVSPYGKSFVACMLARNAAFRPTPAEALNDQWFRSGIRCM